jgi:hypothetical protein
MDLKETIEFVFREYGEDLPRFKIRSMNQAEFLIHIITLSFNRGKNDDSDGWKPVEYGGADDNSC